MSSGYQLGIVDTDVGPLEAPMDRWIWPQLRDHGVWEPQIGDLLRAIVATWDEPRGGVVVGAHVGYHVLGLAHAQRARGFGAHVIAYEPSPSNRRLLERNVAGVDGISVRGDAVDSTEAEAQPLWCSPDNSGDMHLGEPLGATRSVPVDVVTLDGDIVAAERFGVLLIDAQGSDLRVLAGAHRFLDRARPHVVLEWTPTALDRAGYTEVERLLALGWSARVVEFDQVVGSAVAADAALAARGWGMGSLHLSPPA